MMYEGLLKARGMGWWCRQVWRLPDVKIDEYGNLALLFDPNNLINSSGKLVFGYHYLFYPSIEKMDLDENTKADMQIALYNVCEYAQAIFDMTDKVTLNDVYILYLDILRYISKGVIDTRRWPEHVAQFIHLVATEIEDNIEKLIIRFEPTMQHDKQEAEVRIILREEAFIFLNFILLGCLFYIFYSFYIKHFGGVSIPHFMANLIKSNINKLYCMFRSQTQEHIVETHVQLMSLIGTDVEKEIQRLSGKGE